MQPEPPSAFGPFELYDRLGQGGVGEVWRARVPGQPLDIAVKLLRDDRWGPESLARFMDEARATAALDHPNLVQVLDFGTVLEAATPVPYLAMDLASGGTLAVRGPELSWDALSSAILQILDGLAHAHARGTTHLDIKSENVILGVPSDGRTGWRVVDFGIAHAMGRVGEGRVSGTPTHMSPEQWRGDWRNFGPWTDIYAVGCMVWRLVTGAPVYGGGVVDLALLHQRGHLPAMTPIRPAPAGLAAWLARALRVDPADRFQHAADAADAWRDLGPVEDATGIAGSPSETDPSEAELETFAWEGPAVHTAALSSVPLPPVGPRDRPIPAHWTQVQRPGIPVSMGVLGLGMVASRVPPLVGRREVRDRLWTALCEVGLHREPRALCLVGATGCGKTRLATWLAETAALGNHAQTLVVHHGSALDAETGLQRACIRALRCEGLTDPAEVRAQVMRFVRGIGATDSDDIEVLVGLGSGASAEGVRRHLHLMARQGPLVLILDDVHHAPRSLELAMSLSDPILVLATWTGAPPSLEPPWERVAVGPLPEQGIRQMVEGMLPLTSRAVARLVQGAEGNPEVAVQRILHHARCGDFTPEGDRYGLDPNARPPGDDPDDSWRARVEAVLAELSPADRAALTVAAALGRRVIDEEWLAAVDVPPSPALEHALFIAQLAARPPRSPEWRFTHPRIRVILEDAGRADGTWSQSHARCAEALQALGADWGRVGTHLLEAGRTEQAIVLLVEAAEQAFSDGRLQASALHLADLERAFAELGRPETDPDRIDAMVVTARLDRSRHGPRASVPVAERALALARIEGDPDRIARAGRAAAMSFRSARRLPDALSLLEALLEDPGPKIGTTQRSRLLAALGLCLCDTSVDDPTLLPRAHAVIEDAVGLGGLSPAQHGDMLLCRARLHTDPSERRALSRQALAVYERAGTVIGRAVTNYDLASIASDEGELQSALEHYREAARLFDLAGAHAGDTARLGLGHVLSEMGHYDKAIPVFTLVVDHGRRRTRNELHFLGLCGLIGCAIDASEWDRVDALVVQAEAVATAGGLSRDEVESYLNRPIATARSAGREATAAQLESLLRASIKPA